MTVNEIYIKWFGDMNTPTRKALVKNNVILAMEEYASVKTKELEAENDRLKSKLSEIKGLLESNNFDEDIVSACIKALEGLE